MTSFQTLFQSTQEASRALARSSDQDRQGVIQALADRLCGAIPEILQANARDLARMDPQDAKYDRLVLTEERLLEQIQAIRSVAHLPDPTGQVLLKRTHANGLEIQKISVPLGVIGVIYESRPNVTVDVAALCLRSANACLLKGGKEAWETNTILVQLIHSALQAQGLPSACVTLLPSDRAAVNELLQASEYVDLIIPRGSHSLIQHVRQHTQIPTIETGAGVCHAYVESSACSDMATQIIVNGRVSRPSVCNSLDSVLIDQSIWPRVANVLLPALAHHSVEIRADEQAWDEVEKYAYPLAKKAQPEDFGMEWLGLTLSIHLVNNMEEAQTHIRRYSSKHSETIITENSQLAEQFLREVDAAAVYHNASTRFTDGGEMGLGAEIGISTQKLHARGPFALEKLVTEKWIGRGTGQIRR